MSASDAMLERLIRSVNNSWGEHADSGPSTPQLAGRIIETAIAHRATGIHIESCKDHTRVRYRVDGFLREANKFPSSYGAPLFSYLKELAGMRSEEINIPQESRRKVRVGDISYSLQISTVPVSDGEKIVMHIVPETSEIPTLKELGYWGSALETVNQALSQPYGLILVAGPNGSGKSTSLYAFLSALNNPSLNVSTIEDSISHRINGANQVQVNPKTGLTFHKGLQALLRQDPNIIMIGGIHDRLTAETAAQAAFSGHLMLGGIHSGSSASSVSYLTDMGIEPYMIAGTVRAIVSQRLVRRLCTKCREKYKPDAAKVTEIKNSLHLSGTSVSGHLHELEAQAKKEGVGSDTNTKPTLSTTANKINHLWKAHAGGCVECHHIGYKGLVGIFEVLSVSPEMQKLIMSGSSQGVIQKHSLSMGMVPLQLDGLVKALRGITSIEEVIRVTRSL